MGEAAHDRAARPLGSLARLAARRAHDAELPGLGDPPLDRARADSDGFRDRGAKGPTVSERRHVPDHEGPQVRHAIRTGTPEGVVGLDVERAEPAARRERRS